MVFTSRTLLSDPGWNFEMGEKSCDLPRGEGWPGEGWGGEVGEEGFVKVEDGKEGEEGEGKDVNGGEVELKESDGKGTVVKEEKEEVKSGRVEDEEAEGAVQQRRSIWKHLMAGALRRLSQSLVVFIHQDARLG